MANVGCLCLNDYEPQSDYQVALKVSNRTMYNIGYMYYIGTDVHQDYEEAVRCYQKTAKFQVAKIERNARRSRQERFS